MKDWKDALKGFTAENTAPVHTSVTKAVPKQHTTTGQQPVRTAEKSGSTNSGVAQTFLPYDFIPVHVAPKTYSIHKKGELHGSLTIQLTTKSPLIAIKQLDQPIGDAQVLPGSSIRGMIRTACEIAWDDVLTVATLDKSEEKLLSTERQELLSSSTPSKHGLVVQLFGYAATGGRQTTENTSFASLLRFSDAKPITQVRYQDVFLKAHSLSKPNGITNMKLKKGKAFNPAYVTPDKKRIAGRKVYLAGAIQNVRTICYAQRVVAELKDFVGEKNTIGQRDDKVRLIYPNTVYTCEIAFKGLTKFELASLIRVIELSVDSSHALGRGKPLGFGRVQLEVQEIRLRQLDTFFDLTASQTAPMTKEELLQEDNPFKEKLALLMELGKLHAFDRRKAYFPPNNVNFDGTKKVEQYFRRK